MSESRHKMNRQKSVGSSGKDDFSPVKALSTGW